MKPSFSNRCSNMNHMLVLLSLLLLGVWPVSHSAWAADNDTILQRIEHEEAFSGEHAIDTATITKATVIARERNQGGTFRVLARKTAIQRYPCASCHNNKPVTAQNSGQLTHGNIVLQHGQAGALSCIDCHSEKDRDSLTDKEGNEIDFDHSYQLCGQCHFRQKSDWLGGAHGKRVTYWAGERVIYNCTTCHDPHSPLFEKRFPATFSPESP